MDRHFSEVQSSYDQVAGEYAARIFAELADKPLDRQLLDQFAERVRDQGLVADLGCGPGHVARYLSERGVAVCGIDLSPAMVAEARRLNPGIAFQQGNLLDLPFEGAAWAGATAFYSTIHIPPADMVRALNEIKRVLRPGAPLFLAFHLGESTVRLEEWWGKPVAVDFFFYPSATMDGFLREAGFAIETIIEREPYPEVEHQSRRCYIVARAPAADPAV